MSLDVPASAATGGAGTAGAAGGAAVGGPPVPATFPEKFALATALRDDHAARFAKLRTAPAAKQYTLYVDRASVVDFTVTEDAKEMPVDELLDAWSGPIELTPVPDTFNDKLDYGVNSWAKLEALNVGMLPVMEKYEMLQQDSPKVVAATTAFITNYRAIGSALAAMEARAAGGVSTLEATKARFAELSARITAVAAEAGAKLGPAPSSIMKLPGITAAHAAFLEDALHTAGIAAPAFELLYQASADGVTVDDVLRKCAGKGPVLVVGREATGGWLFGGYMDCGVSAGSGNFVSAPQAFLFTLTNPHGLPPMAWRRSGVSSGVYHDERHRSVSWVEVIFAMHFSVLLWSTSTSNLHCYQPLGAHGNKVFTGTESWSASDVLIYRV